jgi:HEAT repeat protein
MVAGGIAAQPPQSDPVDGLKQILKSSASDAVTRDRDLREQINKLTTINELCRALVLREWREQDLDERVAAADLANRTTLNVRFDQRVRDVLMRGDAASRLAVMSMLAEIGCSTHTVNSKRGIACSFAADLANLTRVGDSAVREAAAQTLSQINPDAKIAMPAFSGLLDSKELPLRLAAAEGMVRLIRVVVHLAIHNQTPNGVEATRAEVIEVSKSVVAVAGRNLRDIQPEVRRRCVEAIGQAADALRNLVSAPLDDASDWMGYQRKVDEERAELLPLILALKDQGPVLTRALGDPDAEVRWLARRALEDITNPQVRLLQRLSSAREGDRASNGTFILSSTGPKDPLVEGLHGTVRALAAGMSDPDPRARRAAIDVLETLGSSAAPAAGALVSALADPDQFVRWSAARTLGKIGPVEVETAVPGLAHLLADADFDLRLAAATALERYGPAAKGSIADLVKVTEEGDAHLRVAAIHALGSVAVQDPKAAIPAIQAALTHSDSRVRQTAAQILGGFGPGARECVESLRKCLRDSSPEVQKAASEALLGILQSSRR